VTRAQMIRQEMLDLRKKYLEACAVILAEAASSGVELPQNWKKILALAGASRGLVEARAKVIAAEAESLKP
jgi:hypothetical protein